MMTSGSVVVEIVHNPNIEDLDPEDEDDNEGTSDRQEVCHYPSTGRRRFPEIAELDQGSNERLE